METKKETTTKTVTEEKVTYIAFDGKEFKYKLECEKYEAKKTLEEARDIFKLKSVYDTSDRKHYSFVYKSGHEDLFNRMIKVFLDVWNIDEEKLCLRDLSNVSDCQYVDARKEGTTYKYKDGDTYLFKVIHIDECDRWDTFEVEIQSKEDVQEQIKGMIDWYEETFNDDRFNKLIEQDK